MPPAIKVRCPGCRKLLRIPAEWLARPIQCKHCSKRFRAQSKGQQAAPLATDVTKQPVVDPTPAASPLVVTDGIPNAHGAEFAFDSQNETGQNPAGAVARYLRTKNRQAQKLVIAGILIVSLGLTVGAGFYLHDLPGGSHTVDLGKPVELTQAVDAHNAKDKSAVPPDPVAPPVRDGFPRRFLAITIHQYLYADGTSPLAPSLGPGRSRRLLANALRDLAQNQLRVSGDQIHVLSDALTGAGSSLPLKPVIEQTIERFLSTCRPQDRVMLVFVGHGVDIDDQPFLVPLEGELTAKESLIPLSWLYDRLAACPARQKALVMDLCRFDSSRGQERPGSGPLGPKLDAALANPPPGVQVLAACGAGQFSYEYDSVTRGNLLVEGGAFLSLMAQAFQQGGGIPMPEEPLPLAFLFEKTSDPLRKLVQAREKAEQTPRLSGHEPESGAPYDPRQPMPTRFELPHPAQLMAGGLADPKMVEAIFAEVAVPPLRLPRERDRARDTPEQQTAKLAALFPFAAEVMERYRADYQDLREIMAQPQKHPLRVAVIRTVDTLDRQGRLNRVKLGDREEAADRLIEEFRGQTTDQVKKSLTESQQSGPAKMLVELQDVLEDMQKVGAEVDQEPSKRWQAHYDFALAQLKARLVYVHEYNTMLGRVKRDELPQLDPALHNGWRLSAQEKIQSSKDVKDLANDAKKLLDKIIREYPGTPWEVLAKRERFTALGLAWQPTRFGN